MASNTINQGAISDIIIQPIWGTLDKREEDESMDRFVAIVESIFKLVSNKADIDHNHDDRYYTESEIDEKLAEIDIPLTPMYGYCETAAETVAKTVTIQDFTLVTGRTIFVKFKYANTASNPTLNVNSTGALPIYRWGTTAANTTAATNGWQANSVIALTYDGTGWIEHLWQNTQYNLGNNSLGNGSFTVDSAVYRYQLLVHVDKETLSPFNNDNNVSETTKTILTNLEFDPFGRIYYYDSTTTVNAGNLISGGALYYTRSGTDLRYTFNISASVSPLTAHKYVYMKVIPLANGKVKLASAMPLVQELPTTNDGYWYIFLGRASGDYALAIYPEKPVFYHDGVGLRQKFDPYLDYAMNKNAIQGTVSGSIVSIDDGIAQPVVDLTVSIEPVQEGTGDPSPENVRPITGWTGVNVTRTGKNLCPLPPEETKNGITLVHNADGSFTITGSATATTYFDFFSGNFDSNLFVGYKFKFISTFADIGVSSISYRISKSDRAKIQPDNSGDTEIIVQDYGSELYAGIRIVSNYTLPSNGITVYPMLIAPNESEVFSPYLGTTYPISWETEAGTVYGGSLDVTTGVLTVDWRSITLTGTEEEGWTIGKTGTENWYYATKNDILINSIDGLSLISNLYPWASVKNANTDKGIWNSGSSNHIRVRWGTEDTIANWKGFLASNPLHVVYKISEPITYQLTPTEVTTLLGVNNLWADTGDSSLMYWKKTGALVLETRAMITQSSESVSTASKAYGIGDLFIFSNQLLRATASIAIGDTIAIGTNAEAIDIATIISELNQRISALE